MRGAELREGSAGWDIFYTAWREQAMSPFGMMPDKLAGLNFPIVTGPFARFRDPEVSRSLGVGRAGGRG